MLKLIEGTVASVPPQGGRKHPQQEFLQVDTSKILFICGGAFAGLDRIVQNRTNNSGIGFIAEVRALSETKNIGEIFQNIEPEDLIQYGLIPEFVGRMPVVASLSELSQHALVRILIEPKNALTIQYQKLFAMEDCELEFLPEALQKIAKLAMQRKTGARGLRTIMEDILLDTMYEMPSDLMNEKNKKITVTQKFVENKSKPFLVFSTDSNETNSETEESENQALLASSE